MSYCKACGSTLSAGAQFCTNCGAKTAPGDPSTSQPALKKSGGCLKILLFFLIIFLLTLAIFGGLGYWGFQKVKQKVEQKFQQTKTEILKSEANNNTISKPVNEIIEQPCPASDLNIATLNSAKIPIKAGLTLTYIWTVKKGDYEDLTQIQAIDKSALTVTVSGPDRKDPSIRVTGKRNVCLDDLRDGTVYISAVSPKFAETIRDATNFSLSQREYEALKNQGVVNVTFYDDAWRTGSGKYVLSNKSECAISRIEKEDVPFGVIINDRRVELPTIHAKGMLYHHETEFYILDDANNPILLYEWKPDIRWQAKIFKISYPQEKEIEKQLAEVGKVQVYGIYFDFNSDRIRPESEAVLKEITDALNAHPDWKLAVNGHTDNVGGGAYNMDLSNRRAASVKQALVERYNIGADRLTTAGFGMSQPIEANDTPEGRARNRRVELVKQ